MFVLALTWPQLPYLSLSLSLLFCFAKLSELHLCPLCLVRVGVVVVLSVCLHFRLLTKIPEKGPIWWQLTKPNQKKLWSRARTVSVALINVNRQRVDRIPSKPEFRIGFSSVGSIFLPDQIRTANKLLFSLYFCLRFLRATFLCLAFRSSPDIHTLRFPLLYEPSPQVGTNCANQKSNAKLDRRWSFWPSHSNACRLSAQATWK